MTQEEKVQEIITRGIHSILPDRATLEKKLTEKKLRIYHGIDATAPDLHVGHMSQLRRLRRLQDLGHEIILLVGDFTAMIGDPTDKSAARKKLTREDVEKNGASYKEQAGKILRFEGDNKATLRYNSQWHSTLTFEDVIELASHVTVQQLLRRDMFEKRMASDSPIHFHELMYPLMQGYDSVALDVDVETGGQDQIFNMLMGATFMKQLKGKTKYVIAGKLLVDPSGKKIGKTEGNMVTLTDTPESMYEKIMSWGDGIVPLALELCSMLPMDEVHEIEVKMKSGVLGGYEAKQLLARTLVTELHSPNAAKKAEEHYTSVAAASVSPESLPSVTVSASQNLIDILVVCGLAASKNAARRLVEQGGVRLNNETVSDQYATLPPGTHTLQVGKRTAASFRRLIVTP